VKRYYCVGILLALGAPAAWAGSPDISFRHLTGHLYVATDAEYFPTNWVVYIGPKAVSLVGATWTPAMARELASKIRRVTPLPITAVIDISPDPEWSGGNGYWKQIGAKIIAVRITDKLLKNTWQERNQRARKNHSSYPVLPLVVPTEVVASQFTLEHGDIRGFYLGPTHTSGDIFVYFPREQVLDAGSILKPHLGNLADADLRAYPKTLRKLQQMHLKIRTVIAGHWSAVHGPDLIQRYVIMLKEHAQDDHE
jgi:metallo-beta-lactamase class B